MERRNKSIIKVLPLVTKIKKSIINIVAQVLLFFVHKNSVMAKASAGLLVYRYFNARLQVLLVHPGGPFWKNKDAGAWSIPKGELSEGEDALEAAKREFFEETGNQLPPAEYYILKPVKLKSGKLIAAWAVEASFEKSFIRSNRFEMEWPPRSGKKQFFDEVDNACWFETSLAKLKINPAQVPLVNELEEMLTSAKG